MVSWGGYQPWLQGGDEQKSGQKPRSWASWGRLTSDLSGSGQDKRGLGACGRPPCIPMARGVRLQPTCSLASLSFSSSISLKTRVPHPQTKRKSGPPHRACD